MHPYISSSASAYVKALYETNPELHKKLSLLRFTKFSAGHGVLLAKAISNVIVIPVTPIEDFNAWFLSKKLEVMTILDHISEFMYISEKEEVIRLVRGFTQWRHSMVFNPPGMLFMRGAENAIEELTSLDKFVDIASLAKVADVYDDANHLYSVFLSAAMVK